MVEIRWVWVILPLYLIVLGIAMFYGHVAAANQLLPVSHWLTLTPVVLPMLAALNVAAYLRLRSTGFHAYRRLLATALQVLQTILVTALATLFAPHVAPSAAMQCLMSTSWQRLFSAHDAESIRSIQDTFQCCGFKTVLDRPWPFPDHHTARTCTTTYGRTSPCGPPWSLALQGHARVELGVLVAMGILQAISLLLASGYTNSTYGGAPQLRNRISRESPRFLPGAAEDRYTDDPGEVEEEEEADAGEVRAEDDDESRRPSSSSNPWRAT